METFSLLELARIISRQWGLPEPQFAIDQSLEADRYEADSAPFLDLLDRYAVEATDLQEQLRETASGLA